jgi:hypothetical protein
LHLLLGTRNLGSGSSPDKSDTPDILTAIRYIDVDGRRARDAIGKTLSSNPLDDDLGPRNGAIASLIPRLAPKIKGVSCSGALHEIVIACGHPRRAMVAGLA